MRYRIFLFALFAAFLIIRLVHIEADPPTGLSFSAGIWVDEMHNIHQVRNKILFDSWHLDRWPSNAYSPIWALLQFIILSAIGVGYWQMKMLPIALGMGTLVLAYRSMGEYFGKRCGVMAVILLGLDYTFIMYNRLGLFENLVVFFMAVTLFCWQRAVRTETLRYFFLTGFFAAFVFMAKSLYFPLVIAVVLTFLVYTVGKGLKASFPAARLGMIGASCGAVIWFFGCYLPFHESLSLVGGSWVSRNMKPLTAGELLSTNPFFPFVMTFRFLPVTVAISLLFMGILGYRWLRKGLTADPVESFLFFWLFCGIFFLGHLSYAPTRYYLPVLPAAVLMAGRVLARMGEERSGQNRPLPDPALAWAVGLGVTLLFFYIVFPYMERVFPDVKTILFFGHISRVSDLFGALLLGIVSAATLVFSDYRKKRGRFVGIVPSGAAFLLSFYLLFAGTQPFWARVELEMTSDRKDKARIYWAKNKGGYTEADSAGVHIGKNPKPHRVRIGSMKRVRFLRIDPMGQPGTATIQKIRITQPGYIPILFDTPEHLKRFAPIHHIAGTRTTEEGLVVESAGADPHIEAALNPVFSPARMSKHLLLLLAQSAGVGLWVYLLFRLARKPWRTYVILFTYARRWSWVVLVLTLAYPMTYYVKWAKNPDYAIASASQEIGEMLPRDALIAGQGVMAVTIKNRIRHVQAPNWFEENDKIFETYPITHVFVSPYAGYLRWYKSTFPEIMERARVIGRYRILNLDFQLYELPERPEK